MKLIVQTVETAKDELLPTIEKLVDAGTFIIAVYWHESLRRYFIVHEPQVEK